MLPLSWWNKVIYKKLLTILMKFLEGALCVLRASGEYPTHTTLEVGLGLVDQRTGWAKLNDVASFFACNKWMCKI